jgi:hypothetical protein
MRDTERSFDVVVDGDRIRPCNYSVGFYRNVYNVILHLYSYLKPRSKINLFGHHFMPGR